MSNKLVGLLNINISKGNMKDMKLLPTVEIIGEEFENEEENQGDRKTIPPTRALPPRPIVVKSDPKDSIRMYKAALPAAPKKNVSVGEKLVQEVEKESNKKESSEIYLEEPPPPLPKRKSNTTKIVISKEKMRKRKELMRNKKKNVLGVDEPPPPIPKRKSNASKIVIIREKAEKRKEFERKMENISINFECPLTLENFKDPVILVSSGQTYERSAIESWLQDHSTDPITNKKLESKQLVENIVVKTALKEWGN